MDSLNTTSIRQITPGSSVKNSLNKRLRGKVNYSMKLKKNRIPDEYFMPPTIIDPRNFKLPGKKKQTAHSKNRKKGGSIFLDDETIDILKYKKTATDKPQ